MGSMLDEWEVHLYTIIALYKKTQGGRALTPNFPSLWTVGVECMSLDVGCEIVIDKFWG